jgi:hypothetical protein
MAIQSFPAALQPIIQAGFLEQKFEEGLSSVLGYRQAAKRENFRTNIGETLTKTRPGLKAPVTAPLTPSANTNFDNGLSASTWTIEQYTATLRMYGDTQDLNMVTNRVGIVDQFLHNARVNGVQAGQSLDRLARNKLYAAYMGGNTSVRTTLGSPAATIAVDDITGFATVLVNGQPTPVSGSNPLSVVVGSNTYSLTGVTADGSNVSKAFNGVSGTLTFSGNVTVNDATAGNAVVSVYAPKILRPSGRTTTGALQTGDLLTMGLVLDAVAQLRSNAVPAIDGYYNVHLDPISGRQLFADPDFKLLFQGQSASKEFAMGRVIELLDCRFIPTTEAPVQAHPSTANLNVRRPIVVGAECLLECDYEGMGADDIARGDSIVDMVDGIVQVTREPLDRLQQIIAQSWYWIGDFVAPSDFTVNPTIVPSASQAYFKRAVTLEIAG